MGLNCSYISNTLMLFSEVLNFLYLIKRETFTSPIYYSVLHMNYISP